MAIIDQLTLAFIAREEPNRVVCLEQLVDGRRVDGILLWGWRNGDQGGSATADYDLGPGDPALVHVRGY